VSDRRHVEKTRDNRLFIAAYVINERGKGEYKMFENIFSDIKGPINCDRGAFVL